MLARDRPIGEDAVGRLDAVDVRRQRVDHLDRDRRFRLASVRRRRQRRSHREQLALERLDELLHVGIVRHDARKAHERVELVDGAVRLDAQMPLRDAHRTRRDSSRRRLPASSQYSSASLAWLRWHSAADASRDPGPAALLVGQILPVFSSWAFAREPPLSFGGAGAPLSPGPSVRLCNYKGSTSGSRRGGAEPRPPPRPARRDSRAHRGRRVGTHSRAALDPPNRERNAGSKRRRKRRESERRVIMLVQYIFNRPC